MRLLRICALTSVAALLTVGSAGAITGGSFDGAGHPYVGLVSDGHTLCSGSLISATEFVTAAHCFTASGGPDAHPLVKVGFDAAPTALPLRGVAYSDPAYCGACGGGVPGFQSHDLAVVIMTAPVPAAVVARYGALPALGSLDALPQRDPLTLVGYGVEGFTTGGGQPEPISLHQRFAAPSELGRAGASLGGAFLKLASSASARSGGVCAGDSGGPDLLAGSDTILAVNSFGTNALCNGVAYSSRLDTADALAFLANPTAG